MMIQTGSNIGNQSKVKGYKENEMSEWYEAESDNIEINSEKEEVGIFVKQNDFGSVYLTLTFKQIHQITVEIAEASDYMASY